MKASINQQSSAEPEHMQTARMFPRCARTFLWALCVVVGLSACSEISPAPNVATGEPLPTGQPNAGMPPVLSARLLERIERSPGVSGHGPLHFGSAIALNNTFIAVGAPERTALSGRQVGVVFVYQRDGERWVEVAELTASDRFGSLQNDLHFGSALAMDSVTLAVGAPAYRDPEAGEGAGAVYLFRRRGSTWEEAGILLASDPSSGARFGEQLWLRREVLLVQGGQAVYVFERAGEFWVEKARLTLAEIGERDRFGFSLAMDGDYLAVAASDYAPELERVVSSSVYLFRRNGDRWLVEAELFPGGEGEPAFGYSLDLEGETLAIGSGDDTAGFLAGAVYLFENGPEGWTERAKLVPADASFSFFTAFGSAVDLDGDLMVVGAAGDSSQGLWSGSAYLFQRQGDAWIDVMQLRPIEDDYQGAFFGADLELFGGTLVVSAPSEFGNAVYIYEIDAEAN